MYLPGFGHWLIYISAVAGLFVGPSDAVASSSLSNVLAEDVEQ